MERKSRITSVSTNGEGISHLFGIYRSHTPDVKTRRSVRVKFIFVPVMLGSLLLVIFLTIMDITKSNTNAKTLPFSRLPHLYSYESSRIARQNYTNRKREEVISSPSDKKLDNTDDDGRTRNGHLDYEGNGPLLVNRTRLHQVNNAVNHQNSASTVQKSISNGNENTDKPYSSESPYYDFTSDYVQESINTNEKLDRTGRAFVNSVRRKFSETENAGIFQNNNRQVLRTGRIMNKQHLDNMVSGSSNTGSQYVNAPFTVTPMYSNTFAQLRPYQSVKNIKSIGDVLKYITRQTPSNIYITSTGVPENIAIKKAVKFSGTYSRPVDHQPVSNFGNRLSHKGFSGFGSSYSQSYGSFYDPFKKFKPVNPSDINRLVSSDANGDLTPSFSDKVYFTEPTGIINFVPTTLRPFSDVDHVYNNQSRSHHHTSGLHTIAVFKPLAPTDSYSLGFTTQPPVEITKKKTKPFSVTLDIYPMTVEKDQVVSGNSPHHTFHLAAPNKNRLLHPRWKPRPLGPIRGPRFRSPNTHPHDTNGPDNHMIVHLNVFPNRSKKQLRQGRGQEINKSVLNTVIAGGTFGHRSSDDHVDDYTDYEDINFSLENNGTLNPENNEFHLNTGNVTEGVDVNVKRKLSYDLLVEDGETQEKISAQKETGNSDVYDDEQTEKPTTPNLDVQTTTDVYAYMITANNN